MPNKTVCLCVHVYSNKVNFAYSVVILTWCKINIQSLPFVYIVFSWECDRKKKHVGTTLQGIYLCKHDQNDTEEKVSQ